MNTLDIKVAKNGYIVTSDYDYDYGASLQWVFLTWADVSKFVSENELKFKDKKDND